MILTHSLRCPALLGAASILASCGGGGGSAAAPPPPAGWVQGQFQPEANFAALCVTPRTGIDSVTHKAYPDKQGTLLNELNWLRSWNNDLYLWFDEVTDQNPASFTSDATYFDALITMQTLPSGKPKDRFHFTYQTSTWEALSQSGVSAGYGANFVVIASMPPREVIISYTEPGSAAATPPANLARGAKLLAIDGVDLVNATDKASVDILNAGLAPQTIGESHTFSVLDAGASVPRTITLVSANVTETPVQNVHTLMAPNGSLVGYMLFNDHVATAESELVAAFSQLKSAAVRDLVLDIRYNGGGFLDIAEELAYMVAGPDSVGRVFERESFNDKHPKIDPVTQQTLVPTVFESLTAGFSEAPNLPLPTLDLPIKRVFVLTTAETCSASEAVMNGLSGVGVQVIQIGDTTCGKPYGFYPQDNCGTTYFAIQFKGENAAGFGDYSDGFVPGGNFKGCAIADDFTHQLSDPAEALTAAAVYYRDNGACPPAISGTTQVAPITDRNAFSRAGALASPKPAWRENRILGHRPGH